MFQTSHGDFRTPCSTQSYAKQLLPELTEATNMYGLIHGDFVKRSSDFPTKIDQTEEEIEKWTSKLAWSIGKYRKAADECKDTLDGAKNMLGKNMKAKTINEPTWPVAKTDVAAQA